MAIRPNAINRIAYSKRDKRNRSRMERGLYDGYNSLPGEILTIKNPGYRNVSIRSDKRTLYGAQHTYHAGWCKPNYPVPAIKHEARFMQYQDEVWTSNKPTLCLAIFKRIGIGFQCVRYWFNT